MKTKKILVLMLIMIVVSFQVKLSYSQNSTVGSDDLSAVNSSSSRLINPENLQIILQNDTSGSSDNDKGSDWFTPMVTAGAAIGGGVIGSLLTYRHNRKIEEQKSEYARRLEEQRINAERNKEEEFNSRIRELVLLELREYSIHLDGLLYTTTISKYKEAWEVVLKTPSKYTGMSLEKRVSVFHPYVLSKVEEAYHWFIIFTNGFFIQLNRHLKGEVTLDQLREHLHVDKRKSLVDAAIKAIEEQYHLNKSVT